MSSLIDLHRKLSTGLKPCIGEILSVFSDFSFDLEEYLIALTYTSSLEERFHRFLHSLSVGYKPADLAGEIIFELRQHSNLLSLTGQKLKTPERFDEIDFISKSDIRKNPTGFLISAFSRSHLWCKKTSGSTGEPVTFYFDQVFYLDQLFLEVPKLVARAGIKVNHNILCAQITDTQIGGNQVLENPLYGGCLMLRLVIDQNSPNTIVRLFKLLNLFKPAIITSRPELLELIADNVCFTAGHLWNPPVCIFSSGSLLLPDRRDYIEGVLETNIYNAYALTEFGLVASECSEKQGLHVDTTTIIAEVVDDYGIPVANGQSGGLVLSSLANTAMPLIRYKTGDYASVIPGVCSCGMSGPRINIHAGRSVPCFKFSSGHTFLPTYFNEMFSLFPISEYQITQLDLDKIEVLFQPKHQNENLAELLEAIENYVRAVLPTDISIVIRSCTFNLGIYKFERYRSNI